MTTITIEQSLLEQALNALLLPCDRWNKQQFLIVKGAIESLNAALAAPATAPDLSAAYIGAREDLAIWKKRALEAEETARQLNRALAEEVNGPTFMGEPVLPATAPDERIKELEAELAATEIAIAEYRQQCLDNATEIARLRSESEERLQNCAALVAENEQLRKDAERYQWLAEYLVSDDESYDDAIVAATTVKEVDSVIDNAMGASPWAHCFCGVRPQAQHVWQAATDAALERAAEEVEKIDKENWFAWQCAFSKHAAEAIRALKDEK